MADERDPGLSRHYRSLEPLEPSPELDRKILAAARVVAPAGRHRWYYSLAAAAVLVFAVAITLQLERDAPQPDALAPAQPPRLERELRGEIKPAPEPAAKPAAKPATKSVTREAAPRERVAAPAFAPDPRADAAGAQRPAPTPAAAQMAAAPENPERWLERIAELRSRGRHAEADRELAAFRKAYPDYRLSGVMRERVEGTATPSR
jgi:hypothetical protein